MLLFLSEYENKVDKTGRVSVPAGFRAQLEETDFKGFVGFPHLELPCIEAWTMSRMRRLAAGMERMPPLSAQYNANSTLMTKSKELAFDPEGRVKLTPKFLAHTGIKNKAMIAGRGPTFQIWEPERFHAHEAQAEAVIMANPDSFLLGPEGGADV
ncbi:MAG: division/cell wall cluster transcriptional repressor MraZ [Alphaproteobacteria bacterium]